MCVGLLTEETMTTRTRYGTKVRIIRKLPPFRCNGQEVEQVEVENIDERSVMYGAVTVVRLDVLVGDDDNISS